MKKIVALVLSLVMALSLCTVAFAAGGDIAITKVGGNGAEKTKVKFVEAKGDVLAHYKGDDGALYVVSEDEDMWNGKYADRAYAMIKDGATVYLIQVAESEITAKAVTDVAKHDYVGCGDGNDKAPDDCYKDSKGNYYVEDKDATKNTILVTKDGKFDNLIKVRNAATLHEGCTVADVPGAEVIPAKHLMVLVAKNVEFKTAADGKVVPNVNEYKCAFCGRTFYGSDYAYSTPETADAYSLKYAQLLVDAKLVKLNDGVVLGNVANYWSSDKDTGTKADDTKKDGIDSAKTFDAGVAMYVGMSLLSVAGGAVVIGKKKEF